MWKKTEKPQDMDVYKKLCDLHLEVNKLTLDFPKFELNELGSELRRSSNAIPANIAEGWSKRQSKIFLESVNRAMGELRETKHHITMAFKKKYIEEIKYAELICSYDDCGRMLKDLERSLSSWKKRSGNFNRSYFSTNYYPQK